ncbi:DUF6121 family protein [Frigoribacterium salinisoli]
MNRAVLALFGTVLYVATVITASAFESLLLDRDVVAERDAGTLLGPGMVVAAGLVVLLTLFRAAALADAADGRAPEVRGTFPAQPASAVRARRTDDDAPPPDGRAPRLVAAALTAAVLVWSAMLVVGAAGYGATRGDAASALLFAERYAVSPFVLGAAVLAALVVAGTLVIGRTRDGRSP